MKNHILSKNEFEVIFREYYKDLLNYAYTFTGELYHAEEIVQEVFLSFWENRNKTQTIRSIKSYLLGAVKNKSLNLKTRYLNKNNMFTDLESTNFSHESHIDNHYIDLNSAIRQNIKLLPEQCRIIFLMSRFTSFTYAEIAEQLEISVKTVETQMSIALKRLRQALKDNNFVQIILIALSLLL